ncbi:MAG: hypothetical protein ACREQ5_32260, partial [Candidatus Dormibacteria bacterium]
AEHGAAEPVPSWAMPLAVAGFATMASRSPYVGNAIGEGGLAAVNNYYNQLRYDREYQYRQAMLQNTRDRNTIYGRIADSREKEADAATQRAKNAGDTKAITPYQSADLALRSGENANSQAIRLDGIAQGAYDRGMARIDNDPGTMSPGPARQAAIDELGHQISASYPKSSLAQSFASGAASGSTPLPKGVTPAQAVTQAKAAIAKGADKGAAAKRLQSYGIDPSFLDQP